MTTNPTSVTGRPGQSAHLHGRGHAATRRRPSSGRCPPTGAPPSPTSPGPPGTRYTLTTAAGGVRRPVPGGVHQLGRLGDVDAGHPHARHAAGGGHQPDATCTVIAGQTASFTAAATGHPAPTVQWQVSTTGGPVHQHLGATSATLLVRDRRSARTATSTGPSSPTRSGTGYSTAATLTVQPVPPLSITTTTLPGGTVYSTTDKVKYSATLAATSGNPPYTWKVIAGSLPRA